MTARAAYSTRYDPPAPVLPIRVTRGGGGRSLALAGLVDTGADVTVLPESVVMRLSLPRVGTVRIAGVVGHARAPVHAAMLEVAGRAALFEVIALSDEAILGRNVLNALRLVLDGPQLALEVGGRRRPRR